MWCRSRLLAAQHKQVRNNAVRSRLDADEHTLIIRMRRRSAWQSGAEGARGRTSHTGQADQQRRCGDQHLGALHYGV